MKLTSAEALAAALAAVATVLVALGAFMRWIYHQGSSWQKLTDAVEDNTSATKKLSGAMEHSDGMLADHEVRISKSEVRIERAEQDIDALHQLSRPKP